MECGFVVQTMFPGKGEKQKSKLVKKGVISINFITPFVLTILEKIMKFNTNFSVFIISLILFFSCKGKTYQRVEIDIFGEIGPLNINIEKILPLETLDHSLIGEVSKVRYNEGRYYVLDRLVSQNLFLFDQDGNFLKRLSRGRGPGEVLSPIEFVIDSAARSVFVWDTGTHYLSEYDLNLNFKSAEFIEDLFLTHAEDIGNGLWLIYNPVPVKEDNGELGYFLYSIYDLNNKNYLAKIFPIKSDLINLGAMMPISVSQNRVLFSAPFSNFLYSLQDSESGIYREEFLFNFGSLTLHKNDIEKGISHVYKEARGGKIIIPFYGIGENREFISFNFSLYGRDNFLLFSKKTKGSFYSETIFQEKILPKCRLIGSFGDNQFLAFADPIDVLSFFQYQADLYEMVSKIHDLSNPCIIIFSVRENENSQ